MTRQARQEQSFLHCLPGEQFRPPNSETLILQEFSQVYLLYFRTVEHTAIPVVHFTHEIHKHRMGDIANKISTQARKAQHH